MAISVDPSQLISNAITEAVGAAILMGMPTKDAPVPNFVLMAITDEQPEISARLTGSITQAGEFNARTIVQPSTLKFTGVISEDDTSSETMRIVQTVLSGVAGLANSVASFGAVLPNLSGLTTGFLNAQVVALNAIKNNRQPILLLGAYFSLNSLQQQTPYLSSKWYIERVTAQHDEQKRGAVFQIEIKEQLERRDTSLLKGGLKAVAGEILSPLAGQTMSLVPGLG